MSAASTTVKFGVASVLLPATGFIIGTLLYAVLPNCKCDTGGGCHGCGSLGQLIEFLMFGGFVGALAAAIFVLPASLVVAGILRASSRGRP